MWKEIQVSDKSYYMNCHFSGLENVIYTLSDGQQTWFEKVHLDEVKKRVKLLNRRFDYNETHIRTTLTEGDLESVTKDAEGSGANEKFVLKFKYRVLGRPFLFTWSVKKQTLEEFQATFVKPLFKALLSCQEQIEILTDNLRKKDAEILQYRKEGAILNRKTLATRLFDFEEFSKKYESSNKIVTDFNELGKFIIENESKTTSQAPASPQRKVEKQENNGETKSREELPSGSPGYRKRKFLERQLLEKTLKTRRKCLEYESSQSQTYSSSSQSAEESKDPEEKAEISDQDTKARRSSRCTPIKENNEKKSSDDSESDDLKSSMLSRKKSSRNLNLQSQSESSKAVNTNTDKNVREKEKSQNKETSNKDANDQERNKIKKTSTCSVNITSSRKRMGLTEEESPKSGKEKSNTTGEMETQDANPKKSPHLPYCSNSESDEENLSTKQQLRPTLNKDHIGDKVKEKECSSNKKLGHSLDIPSAENNGTISSPSRKIKSLSSSKPKQNVKSVIVMEATEKAKRNDDSSKDDKRIDDNNKNKNSSFSVEISDSESDEEVIHSTPRKRINRISDSQSLDVSPDQLKYKNKGKTPENKKSFARAETLGQDLCVDENSDDVVEILTDSDCDETSSPTRRLRKRPPPTQETSPKSLFVLKSRITRSSPLVLTTPTKLSDNSVQRRSDLHNKPLALGEISSQLEAIRKELESLEALRLADLKHRTCKT